MNAFSSPSEGGALTIWDPDRTFSASNRRLAILLQRNVIASLHRAGWPVPDRSILKDTSNHGTALTPQGAAYGHEALLGPYKRGWVSHPSYMPGAIIEPLFLTRPTEADIATSPRGQAVLGKAITNDQKTGWKFVGGVLQQVAAFFGISCFTVLAARWGRRPTFLLALFSAWASLVLTFSTFHEPQQIWYLWPLLGFCTFAPFGGYAIYFPELFPTRLRSTGTSFCYNVGRFVAASGPAVLGLLTSEVYHHQPEPMRYAGLTMCGIFLLGLVVLPFAPETKGQPLPEDDKGLAH